MMRLLRLASLGAAGGSAWGGGVAGVSLAAGASAAGGAIFMVGGTLAVEGGDRSAGQREPGRPAPGVLNLRDCQGAWGWRPASRELL